MAKLKLYLLTFESILPLSLRLR